MGLGGSRQTAEAASQPDSVYWAAYFGRVVDLRGMLDAGADVNQRESEFRRTPLIATAFKDRWEAALLLLERRAQLEAREESLGCTALMIAAQYNAIGVAQVLLEAGAEPDAGNEQHGQTALMWCCQYDHAQLASLLLSHGADVSRQRRDTVTPLMIAAKNNAYSVAALLLDSGADPNLVGNGRFTSLMICAMVDALEVAQLLLRHGADKATPNREGKTALILCAENGSLRVAQLLLDTGADPDIACQDGQHSAATVAAMKGRLEILRLLVEHGANFQHRCTDGRGLVELAESSGSQPMVMYVRRLMGDLDTKLHWAAASEELPAWSRQQQHQQQHQQQQPRKQEQVEELVGLSKAEMLKTAAADVEAEEEAVTPVHVQPLGPNTFVPFEKQLLDDQRQAERHSADAPIRQELTDADDEGSETVEEPVEATRVRPLGPDTGVSLEQQLRDDQKRASAQAAEDTEAEDSAVTSLARNEDSIRADEAAEEAISAWDSLVGLGVSGAGAEGEDERETAETADTQSSQDAHETPEAVDEEAVTATHVQPLGPNTFVPFEKQLLDDQRQAERHGADAPIRQELTDADDEGSEAVEEPVEATRVRPLGPDTGVSLEQQLRDDQKRASAQAAEDTQAEDSAVTSLTRNEDSIRADEAAQEAIRAWDSLAGPGVSGAGAEEVDEKETAETADTQSSRDNRGASDGLELQATSATTATDPKPSVQQQKPASKFPNKKYTVTKRIVTTETTGKQVNKREAVVKLSVACGDVSESVCQTEGPRQAPKWKSQRDTVSQFQK